MPVFSELLESHTEELFDPNYKLTEKGSLAYSSSLNSNVDLFFNLNTRDNTELTNLFFNAMKENSEIAMRILFYLRDPRNGAGMRNNFRVIIEKIAKTNEYKELLKKNLDLIVKYGRYDDLLHLMNTELGHSVIQLWKTHLKDTFTQGLAAKWLPRESSKKENYKFFAKRLAKALGMSLKEYRKFSSVHTDVIEQKMCANTWNKIIYSKVPSQAMHKNNRAFLRNDENRFTMYKECVKKGDAKINTATLWPHQLIDGFQLNYEYANEQIDWDLRDLQWKNLPINILENTLVVADTSGSMTCTSNPKPLHVSIGMALYTAKVNQGIWSGKFITFSDHPQFHKVDVNAPLIEQLNTIKSINIQSTNFNLVFNLILSTAIKNSLEQKDMPNKVLVLSDMEFDQADGYSTNWNQIKRRYASAGYNAPEIIFWNVAGRNTTFPVTVNDEGIALISGYNISILNSLNGDIDPISIMMKTIEYITIQL